MPPLDFISYIEKSSAPFSNTKIFKFIYIIFEKRIMNVDYDYSFLNQIEIKFISSENDIGDDYDIFFAT
ncbi:hypothetical protein OXIME_000778 [Oxyplasma meridianum]|uniref:Uncharacterized protein n=1 Tax=Oxyplasma meridianum TaxID=3073602 RepID=A0AAX4NGV7_9ARCH